jgi:adenosylhomocysteine nucleosidase
LSAGVVAALVAEARTLGSRARQGAGPAAVGDGTLVMVSGMGLAAAAAAAQSLLDAGATALVSWGLAGGLDPALPAGTICLPTLVISETGASFGTAHHWREAVAAAIASRRRVADGKLLSNPRAIVDVAGKAAAFRHTGAVAVDMESSAVAEVAAQHRVPFLAVRVIVDAAGDAVPGAARALTAGGSGQVNIAHLLRGLAGTPGDIVPLLRLARRYRLATRALASVARSGVLAPMAFAVASGNRIT